MLSTMRHVGRLQAAVARRSSQCRHLSAPASATARSPPSWTPSPSSTSSAAGVGARDVAARTSSATLPVYTPSLWDRLFNRSSMPRVPLTEAFPSGLPQPSDQPLKPLSEEATITTLPNGHHNASSSACTNSAGLRVATLPSHSPIASVGVFCDVGSRYETPETSGITHFLELMSLKTTSNRTDFRLVREMLKMGANVSAAASRECMVYAADCLPEHVPAIIGTLADVIQHHIFHVEELMEEKEIYESELQERDKLMDVKMMEAIHEAAYLNNTLGLPLYAPLHNLPHFTADSLKEHQMAFFTPKRMVITGVGVDHQQLVELVQATFTELQEDSLDSSHRQSAQYTGGDVRVHKKGDEGLVHVALAFETANWHSKDLIPMCVLQTLMGGGGSFSAGGPGKGMYSRLYHNILNKHDWAESAVSFNSIYTDSALFGIYGTTLPDKSGQLVEALSRELLGMSGPVQEEELSRAKAQLQSSVFMQLESRSLKLEDIGRQVMTYGKVTTAQELSKQIDQVTAADVQRVAAAMLRTPLSVAAIGDLSHCPRYDIIAKKFTDAANQTGGGGRGGGGGGGQRWEGSGSGSSGGSYGQRREQQGQ